MTATRGFHVAALSECDLRRLRQAVTIVGAVAQVVLPTVAGPRFEPGHEPPDVISPAPYTFAVWLPIFGLSLRYAFRSTRTPQETPLEQTVGWPLAGAFASTAVWAPLVRNGRYWPAQVALAGIAGCAELARRRLAVGEDQDALTPATTAALLPAGMLAAWGATATAVNLNAMVAAAHWLSPRRQAFAGVLTLAAVGIGGAVATFSTGGGRTVSARSYAGTLIWGLIGVAVGQRRRFPAASAIAAVAALPIAFAAARSWPRAGDGLR